MRDKPHSEPVKEADTNMKDAEPEAKPQAMKQDNDSAVKQEASVVDQAVKKEEIKEEKPAIPMPEKPQLQLHGKLSTTGSCTLWLQYFVLMPSACLLQGVCTANYHLFQIT